MNITVRAILVQSEGRKVFAYQRGMIATDFDAITGQWATQGPNLYMIARKNVDPTRPEKEILDEFYQSFGPGAEAVKNYFERWEEASDVLTATDKYRKAEQEMRVKGFWSRFLRNRPASIHSAGHGERPTAS
ncbi:MAG: hypothetical protein ACC628_27390 [Pirellulaceae bacterium]